MNLAINMRTSMGPLTGVQRYAIELAKRFEECTTRPLQPARNLGAIRGQIWEQFELPGSLDDRSLLWSPGNVGPLRIRNQVVTIHDATTFDHPEWFSWPFALWYRMLLPRLAKRVRGIVTVSEDSKRRLLAHLNVPDEKIRVIYNGVSSDLSPAPQEHLGALRGRLGLKKKYFAYLGSLEPRKNLKNLLDAWRSVARDLPEFELLIVGSASKIFAGETKDDVPMHCRFLGRLPDEDLPAFLSGAHALVYPSLYEGFGLPPLEAMACGVRVAVSDIPVLREVCSTEATYFDPLDIISIQDSLVELAAEESCNRQAFIDKGRERARGFSWERSACQHIEYFQEMGWKSHV